MTNRPKFYLVRAKFHSILMSPTSYIEIKLTRGSFCCYVGHAYFYALQRI